MAAPIRCKSWQKLRNTPTPTARKYLGDPDFVKVPWQALTNKAYAKSIADQIDINKAKPSSEIRPGKLAPYESNQTTHYSVVDKDGNAVAVTYTLNTTVGTGIVAGESGILLNNQMDDFSAKPGVPNVYGLVGGDANAVGPNKRPLSSMSPTIVVKDGKTGWSPEARAVAGLSPLCCKWW